MLLVRMRPSLRTYAGALAALRGVVQYTHAPFARLAVSRLILQVSFLPSPLQGLGSGPRRREGGSAGKAERTLNRPFQKSGKSLVGRGGMTTTPIIPPASRGVVVPGAFAAFVQPGVCVSARSAGFFLSFLGTATPRIPLLCGFWALWSNIHRTPKDPPPERLQAVPAHYSLSERQDTERELQSTPSSRSEYIYLFAFTASLGAQP